MCLSKPRAITILGIVVTLILMCATMSVVIYYRRRFNRLKTELAHVHYHAGPDNHQGNRRKFHKNFIENSNSDHDHHHFDNPVYSTYRNTNSMSGTPLNNARLHNRIVKNINSDREKAAASSCPRISSSFIEEDDISDTTSERGMLLLIYLPLLHLFMVCNIYQYTFWRIRVYLPVNLAAIASINSYSNSCGVECTDRRVYSLCWVRP